MALLVTALLLAACGAEPDLAGDDRPSSVPTPRTDTTVVTVTGTDAPNPTVALATGNTTGTAVAGPAVVGAAAVPDETAPGTTFPPTPVTTAGPTTTVAAAPSAETGMSRTARLSGDMSPKSVVASGHGLVFAQNMMYTHTMSVFKADGTLAATIPDSVNLEQFGIAGHPGTSKGAPVEAAFTSDGRYAYVSNYSMYGNGFGPEGDDDCTPSSGYDDSFLYRVDTSTMQIDQVIGVGSVPKYVAVTPDDSRVLVTNWCTFDLSVVDAATATEIARVPIGRHPRGIAVAPDGGSAYVAVMGGGVVVRVDLGSLDVEPFAYTGNGPRHIVISPDGSALFVTNNASGTVSRVDVSSARVTANRSTGSQPRSMAISSDGTAVYVVNYDSSTVTKLRADDLSKLDAEQTEHHPIGITYEPTTRTVWVANYVGSILVYDDTTVV